MKFTADYIMLKAENSFKREDFVPGGKGDKSEFGDVDQNQLHKGIKVELEHTDDADIAAEIALDHLKEDPAYYTKLEKVHQD